MIPPQEVINTRKKSRKINLWAYFWTQTPPYHIIRDKHRRIWRLKGGLKVHFDNGMFFFRFSIPRKHLCILEADYIFIKENLSS